jgi:hypothetical protein
MSKRPYIIGGSLLLFGYIWAFLNRTEKPISEDLIEFHRNEQMQRLKGMLNKAIGLNKLSTLWRQE